MLKSEANFWWESIERSEDNQVIPWTRFKELFFEKYFPSCLETKMEMKFLELKQEDMTVAEYEAKFTELSRFAPHLVDTERRKARRFEQGLTPWIYNKISVLEINNYAELVQKAIIVENSNEILRKYKEERKRKSDKDYNHYPISPHRQHFDSVLPSVRCSSYANFWSFATQLKWCCIRHEFDVA